MIYCKFAFIIRTLYMEDFKSTFKKSWRKHPIIWNLVSIAVSLFVLAFITLCFLDVWTHHGSTTTVPDVIGMRLNMGVEMLKDADLEAVVSDSVYSKDKVPGSIVDVIPQPNSIVKAGREVYLTIVAFSPEPVIIDILLIDTSAKQAEAYLKSKGLHVEKRYVPAEYSDVVVGAKCNGRNLTVGSKVTINDTIILEIGKVPEPVEESDDPLDLLIESSFGMEENGSHMEVEGSEEIETVP